MFEPSVKSILRVMNAKGYHVYDTPGLDGNLNLVGIRNCPHPTDAFDDTLCVFHRFTGRWHISYYPITTDPSRDYLKQPFNPKGAAVLKPGQYRSCFQIDIHRQGKPEAHRALCQRLGAVTVFRYNPLQGQLDTDNPDTGMFGINIHMVPPNLREEGLDGKYSAGCQVFADDRDFAEFLARCEKGAEVFGNRFTYTLLEKSDFESSGRRRSLLSRAMFWKR